jgi:hypothetical protein
MTLNASNLGWYWLGAFSSCVARLINQESDRYGIPGWTDVALLGGAGLIYSAMFCGLYAGYGILRSRILKKEEEKRYHVIPLLIGVLVPHLWLPILKNGFIPIPSSLLSVFIICSVLTALAYEVNDLVRIKK